MPIANYTDYKSRVERPNLRTPLLKSSITTAAGRLHSLFTVAPLVGSVPSTPVAPDNTTPGALSFTNSSDIQRIAQVEAALEGPAMLVVCDRLSHQGGLSGAVTGAQTTNLPTAALTRYTDGVGVMAGLEIYSGVGTIQTTVTASYTNEAGVSGRTTVATDFGGTGFREVTRIIPLPLAAGDRGVQAVASVTLPASTGVAGNFGVTLFKPLFAVPYSLRGQQMLFDSILGMCGNMPQVLNNACLFVLVAPSSSTSGVISAHINIIKE